MCWGAIFTEAPVANSAGCNRATRRTERDFIANQIRPELPTGVKVLRACLGDTTNGVSVVGPFSYAADTIKMGAAISGDVGLSNFNRKQVTDVVTSYDVSGFTRKMAATTSRELQRVCSPRGLTLLHWVGVLRGGEDSSPALPDVRATVPTFPHSQPSAAFCGLASPTLLPVMNSAWHSVAPVWPCFRHSVVRLASPTLLPVMAPAWPSGPPAWPCFTYLPSCHGPCVAFCGPPHGLASPTLLPVMTPPWPRVALPHLLCFLS